MIDDKGTPSLRTQTDEQLVEQSLAHCRASFEELARRYIQPLKHYLTQHNQSADADDLVQETFLRAYRCLDQYRGTWRFSTWLFTIARRLSINHRRNHRLEDESGSHAEPVARTEDPATVLIRSEQRENLWQLARHTLSEPQWSALWLYYVEDMSVAEVAQVQGCTTFTVKTQLFRARRRLMRYLPPDGMPRAMCPAGAMQHEAPGDATHPRTTSVRATPPRNAPADAENTDEKTT